MEDLNFYLFGQARINTKCEDPLQGKKSVYGALTASANSYLLDQAG
jgi:hypothetical protein